MDGRNAAVQTNPSAQLTTHVSEGNIGGGAEAPQDETVARCVRNRASGLPGWALAQTEVCATQLAVFDARLYIRVRHLDELA